MDQHREVNALILNAVAQRDTQQLTVAEEHVAGRKDWGSSENGEASFVRRYHNMILEARVELALSTRDENQAESAAKTMLSRLAKGEMQKKDHVSTNANQEMESKVSGWMYSRYMLKELAEVKHEAAKSMKDRINAWGWSLYRSLLRLPLVFLFCALPYLVFGGITLGQSRLSFQVPDWLPGIVFAVYLGLAGLIVLAAVLGVIWFLVFKPGSNDSRTVSGDINPLSMMIPKLLGLLFVTASTLMITDEGWSLVSQAKIPILLMMVLFFASMLFVFIRQVLLQNQQIDQSVKNRRSINILSLILMESYCIALFFSSIWGSILFETCEDDPCHWPSFLPVRLDLQMGDWVPYVHPGPILMWTVQIAFIGIVLNLFLTREKLVDET